MDSTPRVNHNGLASLTPPAPAKRKRVRKAKQPPTPPTDWVGRIRVILTVSLGLGIPCLSLALSRMAGVLASAAMYPLALFALGLMISVLGVSLSHLAWAIGNVTRSNQRASWSLAIALDMSLVLCELCHVYAGDLGLTCVAYTVMLCVALASMCLNVWAFMFHD